MSDQSSDPEQQDRTWCGMTPEDRGLTTPMIDDVFEALSDWRRRAVCRYLTTSDGTGVDVTTLATAVADRGEQTSLPVADTDVESVEAELVETHLPELHRLGIIDFDERSEAVRYWESPTVEKWAEHAAAVSDRTEF
ncbi:ArsR family transcriptional regulator [Halomicroarcula sp. S1AR25-4]|uniref:DUF7344 domain-containing protein n=2 Tax=Haloarculaceae TaxID=1963268 RepID=A0A830GEX5_9EURY|nr:MULTISPECIES: ArsR family transcriptional regulator [Halomicroarcula]MDS0277504.1 ArsR family transcriptional regulator [Halomicroarcula sp. S1AR25-4]GGN84728.1 hypothetical protein GCM10009030_00570 [Halomicroarcula pellucida]